MSSAYVLSWLSAFVFTQLVECPIYVRLLGCRLRRAFAASAITHPIVWFVIFPWVDASYLTRAVLAELFAWIAEALFFARPFGMQRALVVSLVANAASVLLGLLSRRLFGVP